MWHFSAKLKSLSVALVSQAKKSEWTTGENKGLKPIWYLEKKILETFPKLFFYTSTPAPTPAPDTNGV